MTRAPAIAAVRGVASARLRLAALPLLAALCLAGPAAAQDYYFKVPEATLEAHVLPDASTRLEYELVFENLPLAHRLDVVDVGLPDGNYDLGRMSAFMDGRPVTDIRPSTYVEHGVEVHLGPHSLAAGESGTFRFVATVPDRVYSDTTNDALASFRITPTWFGDAYVAGRTDLKIAIHLPEGVDPAAVLHQGLAFSGKALYAGHPVVYWEFPSTRFTGPHMVAVSFPRHVMERVVEQTRLELLLLWWESARGVRTVSLLVLMILFSIFFLRFTALTGWTLWFLVVALGSWVLWTHPAWHFWAHLPWLGVLGLMEWSLRRRRRNYLPPIVSVEGGGVKRGLTAPEAAVVLEMPLGKVLTLVVFGLLKKGLVVQRSADPLVVEVAEPYRGRQRDERVQAAADQGVVIRDYEHAFLTRLASYPGRPIQEVDLGDPLKDLITETAERMSGFDLEVTRAYYRHIIRRAWSEAEALGDLEARTQAVDRNLEWLVLDSSSSGGFDDWSRSGYYYRPLWIRSPMYHSGAALPGVGAAGPTSDPAFAPSFGDVAGSFTGWTENVAGNLASAIQPGALNVDAGGVLDLSGVDRATGSFFEALSSGSGGGGGGGGCACAGCACACACAGGGR